jgi:hypothetical protein
MLGDEGGGWIWVAGSLYPQFSGFSRVFFLQEFVQVAILDAENRLVARAFGLRPERAEHQTLDTGVCKSPGNMDRNPRWAGHPGLRRKALFARSDTLSATERRSLLTTVRGSCRFPQLTLSSYRSYADSSRPAWRRPLRPVHSEGQPGNQKPISKATSAA